MVTQKERVRVSQTSFGTDHTSLPKLDLGTARQSCDKQSSKKKVVSETTMTQPQSVGDMGLPQQEFEAALQLKWQHEAEMKQLKEESAAKQMVKNMHPHPLYRHLNIGVFYTGCRGTCS